MRLDLQCWKLSLSWNCNNDLGITTQLFNFFFPTGMPLRPRLTWRFVLSLRTSDGFPFASSALVRNYFTSIFAYGCSTWYGYISWLGVKSPYPSCSAFIVDGELSTWLYWFGVPSPEFIIWRVIFLFPDAFLEIGSAFDLSVSVFISDGRVLGSTGLLIFWLMTICGGESTSGKLWI